MTYTKNDFTVGDRVILAQYLSWGIGILKYEKNGYGWFIELDTPNKNCHNANRNGKNNSCWYSENFILVSKSIPLSKEERVNQKCKKLWNDSNYIKHNPHLAY